jgi:hypothetical protein
MPGPKQETPAANVVVLEAVGNAAKLAHGSSFPSSNLQHCALSLAFLVGQAPVVRARFCPNCA